MWVYNKNPKWIGNYWCYLSDGNIEKFRIATNGWWRNPKGEHWADTGGRDVIAWWDEPKQKKPDDQSLQLSGGRSLKNKANEVKGINNRLGGKGAAN